jgi:hypothetical protein
MKVIFAEKTFNGRSPRLIRTWFVSDYYSERLRLGKTLREHFSLPQEAEIGTEVELPLLLSWKESLGDGDFIVSSNPLLPFDLWIDSGDNGIDTGYFPIIKPYNAG